MGGSDSAGDWVFEFELVVHHGGTESTEGKQVISKSEQRAGHHRQQTVPVSTKTPCPPCLRGEIAFYFAAIAGCARKRSMNLVSKLPARKSGSRMMRRCSGIVVKIPSTTNISSARDMRAMA